MGLHDEDGPREQEGDVPMVHHEEIKELFSGARSQKVRIRLWMALRMNGFSFSHKVCQVQTLCAFLVTQFQELASSRPLCPID